MSSPATIAGIELTGLFGDVVYLAIVIAFFGLCVLFVKACDAIAGPEPADAREGGVVDEPAVEAAHLAEVTA
jgi:hypothetical protein